jgi:serine/threonine protein kinase
MPENKIIKNFQTKELVASGGMASVYKAIQISLDRTVALKLLHVHLAQDQSFIARFEREAKAAANLNHENIVTIIDYGEADGAYFIAMEYVEGKSLEWAIDALKRIPFEKALAIAYEICQGLDHAHQKGVVHRDIKPANILISDDGIPKIADFGVAQAQNFSSLTLTGSMVGTPAYMSPEQASGRKVDNRSDIFSLGVVMYEMVAGTRPFRGENYTVLICEILTAVPVPLKAINPAIPPEVCAIIEKMIEKDIDKRYASIADVRRDILSYLHHIKYELSRKEIADLIHAPSDRPLHPAVKEEESIRVSSSGESLDASEERTLHEAKKAHKGPEKSRHALRRNLLRTSGIVASAAIAAATILVLLYGKITVVVPWEKPPAAEAIRNTGAIVVHSSPSGAAVVVDNKEVGLFTPVRIDSISAGVHTIELKKNGYASSPSKVEVKGGDSAFLEIPLQKESIPEVRRSVSVKPVLLYIKHAKTVKASPQNQTSFFKIKIEPWAEIYIDNSYIETTPIAKPLRIPSGTHLVVLKNPNFKLWQRSLPFKPGDTFNIDVKLEPHEGSLKLVVNPWADIYIDGKYYETTPIAEPIRLSAGKHVLKCINPTYKSHEEQIDISSNTVTKKDIELQTK